MRSLRQGGPAVLRTRATRYLRRRFTEKDVDPELRQLRSFMRAFNGKGRDLLIFGDSAMFWTTGADDDQRNLAEMVAQSLGPSVTFEALIGAGYNPRIIMAYLEILATLPKKPRAIVVPTSVLMAVQLFLDHPSFSYEVEAQDLKRIVASGDLKQKVLQHADAAAFEEYDRRPAPSMVGARRTAGEIRLIINSKPATRWQTAVRLRTMTDYYAGERLEPDAPGVELFREFGRAVAALDIPVVAYMPPGNLELIRMTLGAKTDDHAQHNSNQVIDAYTEGAGEAAHVVNALWDSPASEFADPAHLGSAGRLKLARRIADELRPLI